MSTLLDFTLRPRIVLAETDHRTLLALALSARSTVLDLLAELERAQVVADHAVPADVVRMGSVVRYRTSLGATGRVRLVYPNEAAAEGEAVSVLTPMGIALIGLRAGQSITWTAEDGRRSVLTVIAVENGFEPDPDPDPDYPSAA